MLAALSTIRATVVRASPQVQHWTPQRASPSQRQTEAVGPHACHVFVGTRASCGSSPAVLLFAIQVLQTHMQLIAGIGGSVKRCQNYFGDGMAKYTPISCCLSAGASAACRSSLAVCRNYTHFQF